MAKRSHRKHVYVAFVRWLFFLPLQLPGGVTQRKNVLLIAIDDLRTELDTYGHSHVKTPKSIDALAAKLLVFERAYSQLLYVHLCGLLY